MIAKLVYALLYVLILLVLPSTFGLYAQNTPVTVRALIDNINSATRSSPPEKLYVQTDKPVYNLGDTIWFKVYLFDASTLASPTKSGLAYIQISDEQNQVVKRFMVKLTIGVGWGSIAIHEKEWLQGYYTVTVYTNWMRNFDENYILKKQIYIGTTSRQHILINSAFEVRDIANKQNASIKLKLSGIDQELVRLKDFSLKITEGRKTWYRDKLETSIDGLLDFNFNIPEKADAKKLNIVLQKAKAVATDPEYQIPLLINRPEKTDLQFMPEGGSMIEGLNNLIGFKALAEDGRGVNIHGAIHDSKNRQVAVFETTYKGMGSFNLIPQPGETYTAQIELSGGKISRVYPLPMGKKSGIVMHVNNDLHKDSVGVVIMSTPDLQSPGDVYYLIGQSRGIGCYGAAVRLNQSGNRFTVSKKLFPSGITRFTLLSNLKKPLNERIVYVNRNDGLQIETHANKATFGKRDSVAINLLVSDANKLPVSGSLSISVIDDAQVNPDSLAINLKSYLLLTSDVNGYIEDPGYYLQSPMDKFRWQQLDNLLLTQGWVNYNWRNVFQPDKPLTYQAERDFNIQGKVTNAFNRPVENSRIVLLSKKPIFVLDTLSNKAGVFNFNDIHPVDSSVYVLQARNKRGKSFNVGIEMNEVSLPDFKPTDYKIIPWYVNIDSLNLGNITTRNNYQLDQNKQIGIHMLHEVAITDQKIVKGSKNLNEDGGADFVLNAADMAKLGKATLGDLLLLKIQGFHLGFGKNPDVYFIKDRFVHFIIDGVELDFIKPEGSGAIAYREFIQSYLNYFSAEDIKGIEVMTSGRYSGPYYVQFVLPVDVTSDPSAHAFIEITTYSGHGPFMKNTPGMYIFKPLAFASQKQFYSPKYSFKNATQPVDIRSTVYWNPNIITNVNGKATCSFYTADRPGSYTITVEGADMNGNTATYHSKIVVK